MAERPEPTARDRENRIGDVDAQRLLELIDTYQYIYPAVVDWIIDYTDHYLGLPATKAAVRELLPSLTLTCDLPPTRIDARDLLNETWEDLDGMPVSFLEALGFAAPRVVITVLSSTRHHSVDLGLLTHGTHDRWWIWLNSNVGGEYHRVISGPVPISATARQRFILDFITEVDGFITEPGSIETSLEPGWRRWLSASQPLPVSARHGESLDLNHPR